MGVKKVKKLLHKDKKDYKFAILNICNNAIMVTKHPITNEQTTNLKGMPTMAFKW